MFDESHKTNRRDVLKGALAAGALAGLAPRGMLASEAKSGASVPRISDLIRIENAKPGTKDWLITNTRIDPKTKYRCPWIEGYCSHASMRAGDKLSIMVSTNPVSAYKLQIYRLGYYNGDGGRLMREFGGLQGSVQPDPETGAERLRECKWDPAVEFEIPKDWVSGVYVGKLTAEREGLQSYVIFIVRDDRPCDFLFQCSDATWLAYNRWSGGWSLYNDGIKRSGYCGPDVRVSWDRPYGMYPNGLEFTPNTQGSAEFLIFEFPLAYWMEQHGYDVSYISNLDTHLGGVADLMRAKAFLSVGHDEYWTREQYDSLLTAVAQGLNVAFLSGDTCWGLIPFLPSTSGVPHRVITRIGQFGELDPLSLKTYPELARFKNFAPTEANLIGARNVYPYIGVADWTCTAEDHWIFAGTGMKNGDGIKNLLGFEWMGGPADHLPGLRVLAQGPVWYKNEKGEYAATIYPGPKDNWVFNAAGIWWCDGLSAPPGYRSPSFQGEGPKGPDPRIQKIATNLFNRFLGIA